MLLIHLRNTKVSARAMFVQQPQVLVHTPSHNYTLGQLTELFKATGDMQSVRGGNWTA